MSEKNVNSPYLLTLPRSLCTFFKELLTSRLGGEVVECCFLASGDLQAVTNVLEKAIAFISSDDGGDMFLRNTEHNSPTLHIP
jgi:hypothetical protein